MQVKPARSSEAVGVLTLAALLGLALPSRAFASPARWSFGVMADNQWAGTPDDGFNPNTVPVDIIKQVDAEFIARGVKFVIDVGDTVDTASNANLDTTAVFRQDLYNAGIGFFPVRGSHEAGTPGSGSEWSRVFPQMFKGTNNATPVDAFTVLNLDAATQPFPVQAGVPFAVGTNFSHPTDINTASNACSYSFDYSNTRFMLLDQFGDTGDAYNCSSIPVLQPWITQQLADPARPQQAFVFGHKNLLGGYHKDNLFGNHSGSEPGDADPSQWPAQNAFINSLATNHVHYYISGHDHHHYESVVTCPDGSASVHQIISASDSSKFYTPCLPVSTNDMPISQDLYKIGYYIYTVDGPRVTVDYYGVPSGQIGGILPTAASGTHATPTLTGNWQKLSSWGYSLNGQEFLVPEGAPYSVVMDSTDNAVATGEMGYIGTGMAIVSGTNTSTATNNYGKAQTKAVDTGWAPADPGNFSDTLTLWGLVGLGATQSETYVLYLSCDPALVTDDPVANGALALISKDSNGNWVNAVSLNTGGNAQFVFGPYTRSYSLGTYGMDTNAGAVWAVLNHAGEFAAGAVVRRPPQSLSSVRIATLSDIHYFAPSLLVSNGSAFQACLAQDRKLLAESAAITKASVDAVIAQEPDIVLLSGDLTKDGELDSHLGVSNLLARVAASGAQVFVIPGNQDVNNNNAMSYDGVSASRVPNVTPDQFRAIYAPFGYNQAVARDPNSLAYVVEPATNLWILCMDSCQYSPGQDPTAGSFSAQRLTWITNQLAIAQARGKAVIGVMHHGLMEHFPLQATLFSQSVLDNHQTVAPLLASNGLKAVFTGHFHAQDAVMGTFGASVIYDIETGSTVTYPCPYRMMDLQPNGQLIINSHHITAIDYDLGSAPDFQNYAQNYLTNFMPVFAWAALQVPPFSLDSTTAAYIAPALAEAVTDHYVGDEPGLSGTSPATQSIVSSLLAGDAQQQQIGAAIAGILVDLPPPDNNLTINLAIGELIGPANGTIFAAGSPTLKWAPIWGAGVYHVTVTSASFSQTFDTTGTSLTLPGNLPIGNYAWMVTPDNGSSSSTGSFWLDYPPSLQIGPVTNGNVHVSWPVGGLTTCRLQFSPDLSGSNWANVSSNWFKMSSSGYFRLIKQ
jgi:3',5'-cyclic AMP phosphodiesterase CpdA